MGKTSRDDFTPEAMTSLSSKLRCIRSLLHQLGAEKAADAIGEAMDRLTEQPHAVPVGNDAKRLRDALAGLVGSGDVAELRGMELAVRQIPVPVEDWAVTINAIHVLIDTAPAAEAPHA